MRLSRLFTDTPLDINVSVDLPLASSHYINHVLRLKNGQEITLFNGRETVDYLAKIQISSKKVTVTPVSRIKNNPESPLKSILFQAIGKPEHIDFIIQKATELGISEIHLFNSQRTQTHIKGARLEKKMAHWRTVMINACEQCGRNILPLLFFHRGFDNCIEIAENSNKLILDFNGIPIKKLNDQFNPKLPFTMLVGAEGGFTIEEILLARNAGFNQCILGPRTLRMETAAISIITVIQHYFGDMQ